ncbi:MAG: GAF domain-containing protein [Desulfobacterales bacterium]|nr:GAF domain-containing protein [Desulfobacterales bacterium]
MIFGSQIKIHKFIKIKNAEKVLEVLFEISTAVQNTQNLNALYKAIHKSLGKVLNTDNFFIANHNKQKDLISLPYYIDKKDPELAPEIFNFSKTGSLTGKVIKIAKPIILFSKDLAKIKKENILLNKPPIGSLPKVWLGAPLIVKKRTIGAVVVQSYSSEKKYKKTDLDILDMVSQHIAFAIERKENDDTIREERQIFEKILDLAPIGLALIENRVFKRVNDQFISVFGYKSQVDFIKKSTEMIYASKKDFLEAGKIIVSEFREKTKANFEYNLMKKNKSLFPAQITFNYAQANNPSPWTVVSVTDITKIKNAQEEKIKHEKLQGVLEMAGAICHELNQPLHAILGYCELLMTGHDIDTKETKEILKIIAEQIKRIKRITKKLLNITQYKTLKYAEKNKIFDIWNTGFEN